MVTSEKQTPADLDFAISLAGKAVTLTKSEDYTRFPRIGLLQERRGGERDRLPGESNQAGGGPSQLTAMKKTLEEYKAKK